MDEIERGSMNKSVKEMLIEVSDLLQRNGRIDLSGTIEDYISELDDKQMNQQRFDEIKSNLVSLCNIRALGDIYIKEYKGSYGWINLLSELKERIQDMSYIPMHD